MSEQNLDIDPGLLAEFIDESLDMLSGLDAQFVALEASPGDMETVQSIFRPVHSVKGNSSFFGFGHVKTLAHELETLLDLVRKRVVSVTKPLIDILLQGVDRLKEILERARQGQPEVDDEADFNAFVEQVRAMASGDEASTEAVWRELLKQFEGLNKEYAGLDPGLERGLTEIGKNLKSLAPTQDTEGPKVPAPGGGPAALKTIREILGTPLTDELHGQDSLAVIEALRELRSAAADDATRAPIAEAIDAYETFTVSVGFDALLQDLIMEKITPLAETGQWAGGTSPEEPAADEAEHKAAAPPSGGEKEAEKKSPAKSAHHDAAKTMRVSEAHIDTFLAFVGELIVVGDMFNHLQDRLAESGASRDDVLSFRRTNETFATLSNSLQNSIMSIRKVSVRQLLQRVPRMVRDIATKSGKAIAVELEGEDVEVDKSLMDMLDAPLTHMVRNAADHGIDPPDAREKAGKKREGTVRVSVVETPDTLVLSVQDDGAGLNFDAIRAKAEALGIVQPGQQLRQDDVVNLIFSSGVSTAKEVTDISGRGVGMDVVKRMLEDAGGAITVESERGKGSTFRVRLPKTVTTQIMPGFLIDVGGQCYVLPMDRVKETVRVPRGEINRVQGKGECVTLHGQILPVLSLDKILGLKRNDTNRDQEVMVTVEVHKRHVAVCVDNVLGVQKVVHRNIEGIAVDSSAIAGGALMGDGSVSLIIDLDKLCDRREGRRE